MKSPDTFQGLDELINLYKQEIADLRLDLLIYEEALIEMCGCEVAGQCAACKALKALGKARYERRKAG